ncbi:MAG: nitroreductase family deazaflavin-dependent oxidoreductase [Chloroflexi bacterium]|nr:nitroreductase family deazaflavin-dependent oxidoreductase [Chloroflexota bacterium]
MKTIDPAPGAFPPLAEPPLDQGGWAIAEPWLRRGFKILNQRFMIPVHRAGLGAWLSTPIGGYMLLLRARGRKSGVMRETPLGYFVAEGSAWVLAGFGPRTEWYRNLCVDPKVEVWMPGGRHAGIAAEELDPAVRARILPPLLKSMGGPALMIGVNPWTATDEAIIETLAWVPLIRISPDDGPLEAGPDDPGGHNWIWRQAVALGATCLAWRFVRRTVRGWRG